MVNVVENFPFVLRYEMFSILRDLLTVWRVTAGARDGRTYL